MGHIKPNCWRPGGGKEGQGPQSKGKGKEFANIADTTHQVALSFMATTNDKHFDVRLGKSAWLADSGCTTHISNNWNAFTEFKPLDTEIQGIGKSVLKAQGTGTVVLESIINGQLIPITLTNTLYAPEAANNLLSVSRVDQGGGELCFKGGQVQIFDKYRNLLANGEQNHRLYHLKVHTREVEHAKADNAEQQLYTWKEWHRKYGHIGNSTLELLKQQGLVEGLTIDLNSESMGDCEACIQAKAHRKPFPHKSNHRSDKPGDGTHSDLWGPARIKSTEGNRYYKSFTDDASRRLTVFFLKTKQGEEVKFKVIEYIRWIERQYGAKPKWIRVDEGKEYLNDSLKKWLASEGIELNPTAPYSPSQNRVSE